MGQKCLTLPVVIRIAIEAASAMFLIFAVRIDIGFAMIYPCRWNLHEGERHVRA